MTFLRWAGSKKQLLDTLSHCWFAANCGRRTDGRYIEAFSGSAALFFHLAPRSALLVDVNKDLQNCFMRVRQAPKRVSAALRKLNGGEAEYYCVRALSSDDLDDDESAARFIYLNRNCFNGLYRTNKLGRFNVPFGGGRSGQLPTSEHLIAAAEALKGAKILCGDFFDTLYPRVEKNDFVYLDPPYATRNVNLDNQYGPDVFGMQDIARLSELVELIDARNGQFVISYADCEEIRPLADRWSAYEVTVRRTIAASTEHRHLAKELLVTNI